jgi:ribosome-binding protein aMBF1 (putative translation factor)
MKTLIKNLTTADLTKTIKILQSLLLSNMPINVRGIKGRIRKLQATLKVRTQCPSSKSAEQEDAKALILPPPPPTGSPSARQDYQRETSLLLLLSTTTKFGEKVAECRAKFTPRLSQHELAKRLNNVGLDISPAEVAEIEEGKRFLNYCQVSVLASVLNATVFELNS